MAAPAATTQTSFGPLPQIPFRVGVTPRSAGDQFRPSQRRMVPVSPTIQASLLPVPQTRNRRFETGLATDDQPSGHCMAGGFEQIPSAGSHVPAAWFWSIGVQTTG